jgi:hypothetical protein
MRTLRIELGLTSGAAVAHDLPVEIALPLGLRIPEA